MPKTTFLNLSITKRQSVEVVLIELLSKEQPSQLTVKQIIDRVDFSRAAFYKYFADLEDAISYVTKIATEFVHQNIMQEIMKAGDFLSGSRSYLAIAADYEPNSKEQGMIMLLKKSGNSLLFKRNISLDNSELIQHFLKLLAQNQLAINDETEAISFLYFMMNLVINALFEFTTNDWTKEQLLQDFDFRVKWLLYGLHK